MSRGRGRGRGGFGRGGGGGFIVAKQEPFVLYPEITFQDREAIQIEAELVTKHFKFEKYWKSSPFFLGDGASRNDNESFHLERYSDMEKKKKESRPESLLSYLILTLDNFPKEMIGDSRKVRRVEKARWSGDADLKKLDSLLEEEKKKDGEGATNEEEAEVEDEAEEDEAEYSDDGDYNQGEHVDDDEDDYNDPVEGDDEPTY